MILDAFGNARWQYIHLPGESFEHIYNYIYRGNIPILLGTHFNIYIYICVYIDVWILYPSYWGIIFIYVYRCFEYIHLIGESCEYSRIDV